MRTALLVAADIAIVLAVSRVLRGGLARVRQPAVMGEVLTGLLLGASVLGALPGDPSDALFTSDARAVLTVLGQVALVAYVFAVGVELEERGPRREGRAVAAVALASSVVPALAGGTLALALHGDVAGDPPRLAFALFLATAFGVSAFPVLARIVDARGLADVAAGRVALAAAAGQELLVWPALAVAVALAGHGGRSPLEVLASGAVALALTAALARLVVPALTAGGGIVVLAGLGVSAWATDAAGLHLVLGAFAYGALLAAGPRAACCALLRTRPATVASALLLPLFFAIPALRVDVGALGWSGLGTLAAVLVVAAGTKLASAAGAARLAGLSRRDALTVGALMNARGLVELVVLGVGLDAGLIDARLFGVLVLMALLTTFATGPLVEAVGRRRDAPAPARPAVPR